MTSAEVAKTLDEYEAAFTAFREGYELPDEWFRNPDHFAIKCADRRDYDETYALFRDEFVQHEQMWEIKQDWRLLASGPLQASTPLCGYEFTWVEIMQPRPRKELPAGFAEHTEFMYPFFDKAARALKQRGFTEGNDFEMQQNDGHTWLNLVIDGLGREIKLNNRLLCDVVARERGRKLREISHGNRTHY